MAGAVQTFATMCPMNCHPTLCGMLVDVQDGEVVGVRGDKDNPDSQGFLCVRGQASRQIIGNPKRLLKALAAIWLCPPWSRNVRVSVAPGRGAGLFRPSSSGSILSNPVPNPVPF